MGMSFKERKLKKQSKVSSVANLKYKKLHAKRRYKGKEWVRSLRRLRRSGVIISMVYGRLTKEQIEAARRAIRSKSNKSGKLLIRVHPTFFLTKKPAQVRMGKGKGRFSSWVVFVKPGKVLFELQGLRKERSMEALESGSKKLPLKLKLKYFSSLYQ